MKKKYVPTKKVIKFVNEQPEGIQNGYLQIVNMLEKAGYLVEPFGKKLEKDLFEIRVRHEQNIRIFYFYHVDDIVYGVHGFVKKTQQTPTCELKTARKIIKLIKRGDYNE
jgi:phage-related protein